MSTEWILERVGPEKEEVVINKHFFNCGRMKENDLVCLSLLVSREHCVFINFDNGLYITDLGSSNGVYINGNIIRPKKQVLLCENDCVGIGCPEQENLDNSMFVYRVKNRVVISNDGENGTSGSNDQEQLRLALREQSRLRRVDTEQVPAKIPKMTVESSERNVNHNNDQVDDDVEIIECSSTSNSSKNKSENHVTKETTSSTFNLTNEKAENSNTSKDIIVNTRKVVGEQINASNVKKEVQAIVPEIIDITEPEEPNIQSNSHNLIQLQSVHSVKNVSVQLDQKPVTDSNACNSNCDISEANSNVKPEPQNDTEDHDPLAIVKPEPDWGCFSQIDLVEINDDKDDNIFPFSQLFEKSIIKEEPEDANDAQPHSSLFLDEDDDENVITILDSDDDNNDFNINNEINIETRIKIEPGLESADATGITSDVDQFNEISKISEDRNVLTSEAVDSDTGPAIVNVSVNDSNKISDQESNYQSSSSLLKDPLAGPSTSKTSFLSKREEKKGIQIIPAHRMSKKGRTTKTEKKDEKSKKDKEHSKSHSSKKKSSSKSTSEKSSNKESSKSKKHREDNKEDSLFDTEKNNSNKELCSTDDKNTNDTHNNSKKSTKNSKNESDKTNNDSNSIQNNSPSPGRLKSKKVNAKVSQKTRNDLLCDEFNQPTRPKSRKEIQKAANKSSKKDASKTDSKQDNFSTFTIPRRQIPSSSILGTSISTTKQFNTLPSTSYTNQISSTVLTNTTNHIDLLPSSSSYNGRRSSPSSAETVTNNDNILSTTSSLKPSLTIPSILNRNSKNVSFKENIADVREFQIENGNQLKNIKAGLSMRSSRQDILHSRSLSLKIEDFLARVFAWEPVWLEQQQNVKTLPPIVKKEDMQQLPNIFNNFEQYYKKMEVLLLLETWQLLTKEYECTGNRYNSSVPLPCTIARHSVKQMQTPYGMRYSSLIINTLVSRSNLQLQNHPVYGDMIILEYKVKQLGIDKIRRAFAYVVRVEQQNPLKFLRSNVLLSKYVKQPDALLTYTIQTRVIDEQTIQFDQVSRLRTILYMRPHLRLIQGLQFVPHSALCGSILRANIDEFQHESVTQDKITNYKLITEENLNERQKEAVLKFTNVSVRQEPKISLLVGPPGTGKSKVIANLVTQILYAKNMHSEGKPWRILVCAPSNAAIDEIVLRLLEIRAAIKENRFKMVRIGRIESMHEEVKKISLTELAKRDAQKSYTDQHQKHTENIEHKKHELLVKIEALKSLVTSNPENPIYRMDLENNKAAFSQLTHKTPNQEAAELNRLQHFSRNVILQKANIIACTLSSCYTSLMETIFGCGSETIPTCIVDEATQCCEAETLIPLMLGVKSLILVGDPNQLPATVMSTDAKKLGLDRSLFTRVKDALEPQIDAYKKDSQDPVILLNKQYRMVNAISHWPNKYFYKGKLIDETNYKQSFPFQPYRVLNLDGIQDDVKFSNTSEAIFVGNLIYCLMTCNKVSSWNKKITIGIITPYQNQKSLILSTIKNHTKNIPDNIKNKFVTEVNTIDSFQGQERDVIVMSCVRSSGIGFLSDQQRLCVALTRAKYALIICGNFTTFQRDNAWSDLLRDARARGVVARLNTTARPHEIKPHVIRLG